jgi:hypothetical protein
MIIRILVVGNSKHHSSNLISLSEKLHENYGNIEIVVVTDPGDLEFFKNIRQSPTTRIVSLGEAEFSGDVIDEDNQRDFVRKSSYANGLYKMIKFIYSKSIFFQYILNSAKHTTIGCLILQEKNISYYRNRKLNAVTLIEKLNPTVVFSFGDRHIDIEAPMLSAAKKMKIPVVLPYVSYSDKSALIAIRKIQKEFSIFSFPSIYKFIISLKFKSQISENYFYQSPSVLIALNRINALSKNPWAIGNGNSDIVCVDNLYTAIRYRNCGVDEHKIRVIGDVAYDNLFKQYYNRRSKRFELCEKYSIDENCKIIVLAMPQFAEQGLMSWEEHWREISHIVNVLSKIEAHVLISLHPRMELSQYQECEKYSNIVILEESLNYILPLADLFIAINSTTVIWSILSGVPVCVLNYFGLDMSMFNHLKSIKYLNAKLTLQRDVTEILDFSGSVDFSPDWDILSREETFDGNVMDRYYQILNEFVCVEY